MFEDEKKKVLKINTKNLEAYQLYLKGLYQWNKRTKEGMNESMEFFKKAVALDSKYVLAYTGIADAYIALSIWGELLPKEALPKARVFLKKALEIDDHLAEIYSSFVYLNLGEWNQAECEINFRKAIDLNPNLPTTHHTYALFNALIGNFENAIEYNKRARELDPLSLIFNFAYGIILHLSRQHDQALDQFQKTLLINQSFMPAMLWSMYSYFQKGMVDEAVKEYQKLLLLDPISAQYIPAVDDIFNKSGKEGFLQWVIDKGLKFYKRTYNHPFHSAICYALMNEKEKALECISEAYKVKSFRMMFIKTEPGLDNLRDDPGFQSILEKVGIG